MSSPFSVRAESAWGLRKKTPHIIVTAMLAMVFLAGCGNSTIDDGVYRGRALVNAPEWKAGYEWTYESEDGLAMVELRVLGTRFANHFDPYYVATQENQDGDVHLLGLQRVDLRRVYHWFQPVRTACGLPYGCEENTQLHVVGVRDPTIGAGGYLDFPLRSKFIDVVRTDFMGYEVRAHLLGKVGPPMELQSPFLGTVRVQHISINFTIKDAPPELLAMVPHYTDPNSRTHSIIAMDLELDWGIDIHNFVRTESIGGTGHGDAYDLGAFFAGDKPIPNVFWLKSFNLTEAPEISPAALTERWGPPLNYWVPEYAALSYAPRDVHLNGSAESRSFVIRFPSGPGKAGSNIGSQPLPPEAHVEVVLTDAAGRVVDRRALRGIEMPHGIIGSYADVSVTFPEPGWHYLGIRLSRPTGQIEAETIVPISVSSTTAKTTDCIAAVSGTIQAPPAPSFLAGPAMNLTLRVERTNALATGDAFVVKDASGTEVVRASSPPNPWVTSVGDLARWNTKGNWTLSWDPTVAAQCSLSYEAFWQPSKLPPKQPEPFPFS